MQGCCSSRGDQQVKPPDLIWQVLNNDDGESEIQDETDGVVVEDLLNGDILPRCEAVGVGAG